MQITIQQMTSVNANHRIRMQAVITETDTFNRVNTDPFWLLPAAQDLGD